MRPETEENHYLLEVYPPNILNWNIDFCDVNIKRDDRKSSSKQLEKNSTY